MADLRYWTPERLARLKAEIADFEQVAFTPQKLPADERKKRMTLAASSCSDENVRYILSRCVDYIVKRPDWVRRDIGLARSHVELLKGL